VIVSSIQNLLVVIYPVVIAPLFNKFEPIQDELLARRITRLMEENGIKVKRILQMNAGMRSRHSNAYFTGL
jgi:STE24 endopeptidase